MRPRIRPAFRPACIRQAMSAPTFDQPAAAAGTLTLGDAIVRRIGFGARWVTMLGPEPGRALLRRALELGVNLIDTADVYGGDNASERMIADALHPYPADLVIATKGGQTSRRRTTGCRTAGPSTCGEACERSLRALRVDTIDLYQLHNPDPDVPLEESLGALVDLRDEGKIRLIGISNAFREQLDLALEVAPIVSVQNQYSVDSRQSDPEVDVCARRGIAYMPVGADPDGRPGARTRARAGRRRHTAPLRRRLQLHGCLPRSPAMLPIPGTSSIEHLDENVQAAAPAPQRRCARAPHRCRRLTATGSAGTGPSPTARAGCGSPPTPGA